MKINYIILAHKDPPQVKQLIEKLSEPWTNFYLHIDANVNIMPFKELLLTYNNVTLLEGNERYPGTWGDIGIVKGTIAALRIISKRNEKGYTVLMSGQDYPLQNNKSIFKFFENSETNYIDINPISKLWGKHGLDRVEKYKIDKSTNRGHFLLLPTVYHRDFYSLKTLGMLNYLRKNKKIAQVFKIFRKRRSNTIPRHYGGSVYWAFPDKTVMLIIDFIENNSHYIKFHEYTLCADEIFFQSILMHIKTTLENSLKINPSLTYSNWERPSGPLPVTFKSDDLQELQIASQKKLWARKFDINQDCEIFNRIDKILLF